MKHHEPRTPDRAQTIGTTRTMSGQCHRTDTDCHPRVPHAERTPAPLMDPAGIRPLSGPRPPALHAWVRFAIIIYLCALTACSRSGAPKTSVREVTGSKTQRVAAVAAIIAQHHAPPTAILDARFVEEPTGDGVLGPSDFRRFYLIEVAPQDVARWTQAFTSLGAAAEYNAPAQPRDWWITREPFASLQFYKPDILTGRAHGWIGVSPQTGRIYIFTFTM